MSRTQAPVDWEKTLRSYLNNSTTANAAADIGITRIALLSRLSRMRKLGVKVPFKREDPLQRRGGGRRQVPVDKLNAMVREHLKSST